MKIVIIAGTNRAGSMSLKVASKTKERYDSLGADTHIIDLQDLPSSIYTPAAYKVKPPEFAPFQDAILQADGLVMIVPEYNGSYPGVLKYFIDMWKYPESFENRCVSYIGISAGAWGALRSVEHLQGVMGYRNSFQFNERVFINKIYSRWADGKVKKLDEKEFDVDELLDQQAANFIQFCMSNSNR
jgi:chromate reductase, NAD(P)H dehydrogenase (quinone)